MKLERDTLNGRKTVKGRHQQQEGDSALFPDDLVPASSLVDLLAETIQRDGKGGLNHMFRGIAERLLVGSSLPDAALSAVISAAVFSIPGTEGCASHMPTEGQSPVNLFGMSSPFQVRQPKEMRAHKDVARAIFATMPAAEIDIEIHSDVERLPFSWRRFPLPRHQWEQGGFTSSRSDQGPGGDKGSAPYRAIRQGGRRGPRGGVRPEEARGAPPP